MLEFEQLHRVERVVTERVCVRIRLAVWQVRLEVALVIVLDKSTLLHVHSCICVNGVQLVVDPLGQEHLLRLFANIGKLVVVRDLCER